jgi:hypothetical protein
MALISVVHDPQLVYPPLSTIVGRSGISPNVATGESDNAVGSAIRQLFLQAGLDTPRAATPDWNPLGTYIAPGASVFLLCNFVYHRRRSESEEAFFCKCTHGSVLYELIRYALQAVGPTGRVRFGNAPLQSCVWEQVQRDTGAARVEQACRAAGQPVESRDLRLFVARFDELGRMSARETRDPAIFTREVILGRESLLEELYREGAPPPRFRVLDYEYRRTEAQHARGLHRYCIHRDILESDVMISVPKLKTHEKVGITCGLKGFVGTVGSKDCLAHHRFGSPAVGGDEYPDGPGFRHWFSRAHDKLFSMPSAHPLLPTLQILERTARRVFSRLGFIGGGAWHGNDTCWRMSLDLARIATYADRQGRMSVTPQRRHLVLIDGIIGGEGEGPLASRPRRAGTLIFSDNLAWGDRIAAACMGFDFQKFPLVREAFRAMPFAISTAAGSADIFQLNNKPATEADFKALGRQSPFAPPRGWKDHLRP